LSLRGYFKCDSAFSHKYTIGSSVFDRKIAVLTFLPITSGGRFLLAAARALRKAWRCLMCLLM
jgi:hypothetical protein